MNTKFRQFLRGPTTDGSTAPSIGDDGIYGEKNLVG
jgi:hypothetical protein